MSRSYLTPINLNQNEIQNVRAQNLAAAPSSPVPGQYYFDSTLLAQYTWNGTAWVSADASKLVGTIPNTALVTNPLARANHTGTQVSATISDLATVVQGYHLNQFALPTANIPMGGFKLTGLLTTPSVAGDSAEYSWVLGRPLSAFAAPIANIPMGGFKLTGLSTTPVASGDSAEYSWVLSRPLNSFAVPTGNIAMGAMKFTGLATPTGAGDSAEYSWVISQVQAAAAGIASKYPVAAVATTNITLSGLAAIDGYTPIAGDRILVAGQTTASANGVYNAASGAWARTTIEGPAPGEIEPGALWMVVNGTSFGGSQWRCSNTGAITIGTTALTIPQFSVSATYTGSNGVTLTGTNFSAAVVAAGGVLTGAGGLSADPAVVTRKFAATIGDGSTLSYVVTHNLNTQDVVMQVRGSSTPFSTVECDMAATSANTATFAFAAAPAVNAYRVVVHG